MDKITFNTGVPATRPLDVRWIHGSASAKHNTDPDIQVYSYDEHTLILRQNMAVNYEAPFLYLLFGADRAVLIDTGATASAEYFPLRATVDALVEQWLATHPRAAYQLVVLHSHGHGDHTAGDGQFADRPDTVVVPADRESAWGYLGLAEDPSRIVPFDLGGRALECIATPGHHRAAVTYYDPHTGFLLTGDTVYPGRLYVEDWEAFTRSIDRLVSFTETRPVSHVLGCHIEMTTTPGDDYPILMTYQPEEHVLELTADHLRQIRAAIEEIGDKPGQHPYPDFVIYR
ncbi:glyoxylase-like metal-dependent hydrolase (beta-lactamase superfamily II) [Kitasatospora gansuensis]|uniref:Glyoxylase-like metal-dependent hydrolase (Beta-lactamase superfamily II) n=1 Tax=Kitasatospora gansuensis TaxID=258050 RepID=A0A7W7SJ71_9ACTN|nr:MBL fold metallo-hydrolase [Kitasatospora gansuensis]MBB4951440.1 glyoxylase-like metal-dependent hydrolase (beta-lactamase superfamily II) [Kitasatospora gansuensis]